MGRQPCCDKVGLKRGPWTAEEDHRLIHFIVSNGIHCWRLVPKLAGLMRCGKSCRLRWTNYLRPDLKRGPLSEEEEKQIIELHSRLGNRWSKIASHFPGRTDNEIKNHWNTSIKKRLIQRGIDPVRHQPMQQPSPESSPNNTEGMEEATSSPCSGGFKDKCAPNGQVEPAGGTKAIEEPPAIPAVSENTDSTAVGSASPQLLEDGNGQKDVNVNCDQISSTSSGIDDMVFLEGFDVDTVMKLLEEDPDAIPGTVPQVDLCLSPIVGDDFYYSESSSSVGWDDTVVDPGFISWEGPGGSCLIDDFLSLADYH